MRELATIILAAGQGKRMKSSKAKVLHLLAGKPLLYYPLNIAREIESQKIIVVVGYQREEVKETFSDSDIIYVTQTSQLGTGHAVVSVREILAGFRGDILLLCGDIPLIKKTTLEKLIDIHREGKNLVTVLTTRMKDPIGYGRIVRDSNGTVREIIEEKDASSEEKAISEVNSGIYCFDSKFLFNALDSIARQNAQEEYYLTDIIAVAREQGGRVADLLISDEIEVMGINNRIELARANEAMRKKILERLMLEGVTIINPKDTYIDLDVRVGKDTVIYPNTFLMGDTEIGENCLIEPGCQIVESEIGSQVTIRWASVINGSVIRAGATIGPFAHIRPDSDIGEEVRIGNFVEVKKSTIGKGSKASHLSYVGDATIGSGVNVGAGTITCNYDGVSKHPT
ncbi:MAG: bifunctional UDP-N-acetylglucosamine diphosphorylase/glucosamine-1-phosphate N-acetyltransferase GlmU, partial [Deltaproteobacteria bacterium]|nr:bifunctional UDP-N-acetylglucosamine diphosphorylase/glucosamine-1-phosphate N-acetyltransferase GlmU [Deltaproteobacteria bacterium]